MHAQDSIVVQGAFKNNTKYAKILMKQFGIGTYIVGSAQIIDNKFQIKLPATIQPGVYRFQYSIEESNYVDVILNGTDKIVAFSLDVNETSPFPFFYQSEENITWYNYLLASKKQLAKIDLLAQFINTYPDNKAQIYKTACIEWENEKQIYTQRFESFKSKMKGTWAYAMVANRPYFFSNPKDDYRIQDSNKRDHFWDNFDASNPKLINSPLYTEHILNYLRFWMNPNMNFTASERTNGFIQDADEIIALFSANLKTKEFAYKYLVLGFKEIGEEAVLQYLDEHYKDFASQCYDDVDKSDFEKRLAGYETLKQGSLAPNVSLNFINESNQNQELYQQKANKIVLVFWSSTCSHCLAEFPLLNEWASKNQYEFKVIAVGIETATDEKNYLETIKQFPNLMHSCNYKGWDTEAAAQYFVAATPTIFLLDNEFKIINKFSSIEQLINY